MVFKSPRTLITKGEITLSDLYSWHAKENSDYPLFRFHDGANVKDITYAEADKAITRCASYIQSNVGHEVKSTIGILANTGTSPPLIILLFLTEIVDCRHDHILLHIGGNHENRTYRLPHIDPQWPGSRRRSLEAH